MDPAAATGADGAAKPEGAPNPREAGPVGVTVEVRTLRPGDEPAIQALFESAFESGRSMREWRWRYIEPRSPAMVLLIERAGEIVGHAAWNRFDAFLDGERRPVTSGGDWMYRADVRGMGLSKHLLPAMFELYASVGASVEFPSSAAFEAIERRGYEVHHLGEVPQWVRWRDGRSVRASNPRVPRLAGWIATRAAALRGAITARGAARGWRVAEGWLDDQALDELAERLRRSARCLRARDSEYVSWRWRRQPDRSWRMVSVHRPPGEVEGWVVAGVGPDGTGRIVDLLVSSPRAMSALVHLAARRLLDDGATLVTCELLDPRPWSGTAMRGAGFAQRGTGPVAVCTWVDPAHPEWGQRESWYLTRGDTDFA